MSFRSLSSILPGIPRAESPRLAFLPLAHGSPVNALDGAVTIATIKPAPRTQRRVTIEARAEGYKAGRDSLDIPSAVSHRPDFRQWFDGYLDGRIEAFFLAKGGQVTVCREEGRK